jgi:hypothetical protein
MEASAGLASYPAFVMSKLVMLRHSEKLRADLCVMAALLLMASYRTHTVRAEGRAASITGDEINSLGKDSSAIT